MVLLSVMTMVDVTVTLPLAEMLTGTLVDVYVVHTIGEHATRPVNRLLTVNGQFPLSENVAVTFTPAPSALSPVRITVCGLDVIGND